MPLTSCKDLCDRSSGKKTITFNGGRVSGCVGVGVVPFFEPSIVLSASTSFIVSLSVSFVSLSIVSLSV